MKKIAIIEPSSTGLNLIPTAKSMGLEIIILSANKDECIIPDDYKKHADHFIETDTYNIDLMHNIIEKYNVSAVIPGSEYHVPIASQIGSKLNLPCVSPKYVNGLRLKNIMRDELKNHNVRSPRYIIINNQKQISEASQYVGFPCVIKPVASAGSVHVSRSNNYDELFAAYKSLSNDSWTELGVGIGSTAILEEYIGGNEFSVEGYIDNNQITIISITEKILTPEPYFVEMGHIVPANINSILEKSIIQYVHEVIAALHISLGIFHCELRVDANGPVLMEIAGRLPGDRISDLIYLSKNINLPKIMIDLYLGNPISTESIATQKYAGICFFNLSHHQTTFTVIHGLDTIKAQPGFVEFKLLKNPGEAVPLLTDFSGRVAYCIFIASTYEELATKLNTAKSTMFFS